MEQSFLEVPWHFVLAILLGHLILIWFKVPSNLVANEGTFVTPLCDFIKFCISTLNDMNVPKMTKSFSKILETLAVGPM